MGEISKEAQESSLKLYGRACIENRIILCGQKSDGGGGFVEKKERKSEAEVVG